MPTAAVSGACGKMGRRIIALLSEDPELKCAAALERKNHPALGKDAGEIAGCGSLGVTIRDSLAERVDVLLDFSSPEGTAGRLEEALKFGSSLVIGTTGHSAEQKRSIEEAAKKIPILFSPNMSVGVNLLFSLVGQVARTLGADYDVEIVEAHHRFKKDSPSGTALRLAEEIAGALGLNLEDVAIYGRKGILGPRPSSQIGIHAVRAGDIVGEHTVIFSTSGERVELVHRAHTRDTFALGALRGAKFLLGKPPALYSMRDVLAGGKVEH